MGVPGGSERSIGRDVVGAVSATAALLGDDRAGLADVLDELVRRRAACPECAPSSGRWRLMSTVVVVVAASAVVGASAVLGAELVKGFRPDVFIVAAALEGFVALFDECGPPPHPATPTPSAITTTGAIRLLTRLTPPKGRTKIDMHEGTSDTTNRLLAVTTIDRPLAFV